MYLGGIRLRNGWLVINDNSFCVGSLQLGCLFRCFVTLTAYVLRLELRSQQGLTINVFFIGGGGDGERKFRGRVVTTSYYTGCCFMISNELIFFLFILFIGGGRGPWQFVWEGRHRYKSLPPKYGETPVPWRACYQDSDLKGRARNISTLADRPHAALATDFSANSPCYRYLHHLFFVCFHRSVWES